MKRIYSRSIAKSINTALYKADIFNGYEYSVLINAGFYGEGFYAAHKDKVLEEKPIWGADKHAAYCGSLINNVFPLSSLLYTGNKTELSLIVAQYDEMNMEKRYKDFEYTLFDFMSPVSYNGKKAFVFTHLDYEVFKDLWIVDSKILAQYYFQDVGKLPLDKVCKRYYNMKQDLKTSNFTNKEKKEQKKEFEKGFYGNMARRFANIYIRHLNDKDYNESALWLEEQQVKYAALQLGYNFELEYKNNKYSFKDKRLNSIRNRLTPIPMWQAAYLRYEEWKLFKANMDNWVYGNTDSIYCDKPFNLTTKDEIGYYDWEYQDEKAFFIRRNAYIVYKKDGSIKFTLGGVLEEELTTEQIDALRRNEDITCHTYRNETDKKNDIQSEIKLSRNYFKGE